MKISTTAAWSGAQALRCSLPSLASGSAGSTRPGPSQHGPLASTEAEQHRKPPWSMKRDIGSPWGRGRARGCRYGRMTRSDCQAERADCGLRRRRKLWLSGRVPRGAVGLHPVSCFSCPVSQSERISILTSMLQALLRTIPQRVRSFPLPSSGSSVRERTGKRKMEAGSLHVGKTLSLQR